MGRLEVSVNRHIRDAMQRKRWFDPDSFSLRLAIEVARCVEGGSAIDAAVQTAVRRVPTNFFKSNPGARRSFASDLATTLRQHRLPSPDTLDVILGFKSFAERQLVPDLKRDQTEAPARAFLQTYLARSGRTYREVETAGGRSDILLLNETGEDVIEAKIWRGQQYHEDGLVELTKYMRAEGVRLGYYVVFHFHSREPATPDRDTRADGDIGVHVVFIHIPLTPPSKARRVRRMSGHC